MNPSSEIKTDFAMETNETSTSTQMIMPAVQPTLKPGQSAVGLKNCNGIVVAWAIYSTQDESLVTPYFWCLHEKGYAVGKVNGILIALNRHIYRSVNPTVDIRGKKIAYINKNKLDNTRENLRLSTSSEIVLNRFKTSDYHGVSKTKDGKWRVKFHVGDKRLHAQFDNELFAAHQHDLWATEHGLMEVVRNNIPDEHLHDFVPHVKRQKKENALPRGIWRKGSGYRCESSRRLGKVSYTFPTLDEAIEKKRQLDEDEVEFERKKEEEFMASSPKRNSEGIAVVAAYDHGTYVDILVDDHNYHKVARLKWHVHRFGYVLGEEGLLSRWLTNAPTGKLVDHVNGNRLDHRMVNLRITDHAGNSENRTKRKGVSSRFIGVSWCTRDARWTAQITISGKVIKLGNYVVEEDAARARDAAVKKYGTLSKLNFPEEEV